MIDPGVFVELLRSNGVDFFTGVPDSLLKNLCAYVTDHCGEGHVIAANEGGAVGLAAGHYLATGRPALVYMQNSGQGNAVNPLASLADPDVYSIPMVLLVGWRGMPGVHDEPQHVKQGKITLSLFETMGIPTTVIPEEGWETVVQAAIERACLERRPVALVVKKGLFGNYALQHKQPDVSEVKREEAIESLLRTLPSDSVIVSTTGMISRELYELRIRRGEGHAHDFLTVGSMGHAVMIALGIALAQPARRVVCLDGDGASIMQLGNMAIVGQSRAENLTHILLNNAAHDSVGGQPTVGGAIDLPAIAQAAGYNQPGHPVFRQVLVAKGARADLGRPKEPPQENKALFMKTLGVSEGVMSQKLHIGEAACETALKVFCRAKAHIVLVTDGAAYALCGAKAFFDNFFAGQSIGVTHLQVPSANPKVEVVQQLLEKIRRPVDGFIAVGGGTMLDTAKLLNLAVVTGKSIRELLACNTAPDALMPCFAMPTTAGTGAEATRFAVCYDGEKKYSIDFLSIRPDEVGLFPAFITTVPPYQRLSTCFDAYAQAIESLWAQGATEESRAYAESALHCMQAATEVALGSMEQAQLELQGSYWAGRAIDISRTTAAHAFSYYLTSHYGIAHGHAVFMVFPYILQNNAEAVDRLKIAQLNVADISATLSDYHKAGLKTLREFASEQKIAWKEMVDNLFAHVNLKRLGNNPVEVRKDSFQI